MISFRYHIVTVAAVFLALAIGLLGGGAFVQPALQQQLEDRTDAAEALTTELRADIDELRAEIAGLGAFSTAAREHLVAGRLPGVRVVVVSQAGVEDEVVAEAVDALEAAGARILTTVSASPSLVSEDPDVRAQLAEIVADPTAAPEDLPGLVASQLATRLSASISPPPEADVFTQLLSGGFLAPVGAPPDAAALEELGGPGQVVVVLSGGQVEEPGLPAEAFAVPLIQELTERGRSVAAGESLASVIPFVSLVRSSGIDGVVTVDDLDRAMGGAALVLGLEYLLTTGEGGDYGVKDGAEPLPQL